MGTWSIASITFKKAITPMDIFKGNACVAILRRYGAIGDLLSYILFTIYQLQQVIIII